MQRQGSISQGGAWILGVVISGCIFGGAYGLLKNYTPKSSKSTHASHGEEASHGEGASHDSSHQSNDGSHGAAPVGEEHESPKEGTSAGHGAKDSHGSETGAHENGGKSHESVASHHGNEGEPAGNHSESPDGKIHEAESARKDKAAKGHKEQSHVSKAKGDVHWTYEGRLGPRFWGNITDDFITCEKGTKQSPLDLVDAQQDARLQPIEFHYEAQDIAFENNGHTLIAKFPNPGNYIRHGDDKYNLIQFHVHAPSEHFVDGAPYDLEVHLVHQNAAGKLLVVGVLMEALGKGSPALEPLWKDLPLSVGARGPTIKFNSESLLPKKREYWSYDGSLTTPPCSEGVKWYVMSHPIQISVRQVDQFQAAYRKNSRPPQPLLGRKILKTRSF